MGFLGGTNCGFSATGERDVRDAEIGVVGRTGYEGPSGPF